MSCSRTLHEDFSGDRTQGHRAPIVRLTSRDRVMSGRSLILDALLGEFFQYLHLYIVHISFTTTNCKLIQCFSCISGLRKRMNGRKVLSRPNILERIVSGPFRIEGRGDMLTAILVLKCLRSSIIS